MPLTRTRRRRAYAINKNPPNSAQEQENMKSFATMTNKMSDGKENNPDESFKWSDSDVQLLLETIHDFKASQVTRTLDWAKNSLRYEKSAVNMQAAYPISENSNRKGRITKERGAAKVKKIQAAYIKAVDAKRKSGGGYIVMAFYDLCSDIWGTSPALNSIDDGIESSTPLSTASTPLSTVNGVANDSPSSQEDAEQPVMAAGLEQGAVVGVKPTARRQLLGGLLQEHKT